MSKPASDSGPRKARGRAARLARRLLVFVALVLVARVALAFAEPWIVSRVASSLGMSAKYDQLSIAFVRGSLLTRGLSIRSDEPGALGIDLAYGLVEIDLGALVRGRLRVERLELDGLTVELDLDRAAAPDEPVAADEHDPQPAPRSGGDPFSPRLPFELAVLRATDLELRLHGVGADTGREGEPLVVQAHARGSGLGSQAAPLVLEVELFSPGLLERATLISQGEGSPKGLSVELEARVRRLRPGKLAPLLARWGLVVGDTIWDADATLIASVHEDERVGLAARLVDVALIADRREALRLDELVLEAPVLDLGHTQVKLVSVKGLRVEAGRAASGAPSFAGLELVGSRGDDVRPEPRASDPDAVDVRSEPRERAPDAAETATASATRLSLELLSLANVELVLEDRALVPAATRTLVLDELTLHGLDTRAEKATRCPVAVRAHAEGLVGSLRIDGSVGPLGSAFGVDLGIEVEGLDATGLEPYLDAAGIDCSLRSASVGLHVDGTLAPRDGGGLTGALSVTDAHLADGDELAALGKLDLLGLELDERRLVLGTVEIVDPVLHVARDAQGALALLGTRFGGAAAAASPVPEGVARATAVSADDAGAAASEVAARAASARGDKPRDAAQPTSVAQQPFSIGIGRFALTGGRVAFRDRALEPPVELSVTGELALDGLELGPHSGDAPARLQIVVDAGALGRVEVQGSVAVELDRSTSLDVALDVQAARLDSSAVEPYLAALGVDLHVGPVDVALHAEAGARFEGAGFTGRAQLGALSIVDDSGSLATLQSLTVLEATRGDDGLRVPTVAVEGLFVRGSRPSENELHVAGVRLRLPDAEPAAADGSGSSPTTPPEARADAQADARPGVAQAGEPEDVVDELERAEAGDERLLIGLLTAPLGIERIDLRGIRVAWDDSFLEPPLTKELELDALLKAGRQGADARSVSIESSVRVDDGHLALTAELGVVGETGLLSASLQGEDLDTRAAATYLFGVPVLEQGRVRAKIDSRVERVGSGLRARVELTDVELREHDAEPLLAFTALRTSLLQPDTSLREFTLEEIGLQGLELELRRDAAGLSVAGVVSSESTRSRAADLRKSVRAVWVPPSFNVEEETTPLVRVENVAFSVERLAFFDATAPGARPIVARGRVTVEPGLLLGPVTEDLAPIELRLDAVVEPVVEQVEVRIAARPFNLVPQLELDLALRGISGGGLVAALPDLIETVDPRGIENGAFVVGLDVALEVDRSGPLDFDVPRVGGSLLVSDLALRDADENVLASLASLELDVKEASLKTGQVHLRSVRLLDPHGSLRFVDEGIVFAGVLLPAAEEPTGDPRPSDVKVEEASAPARRQTREATTFRLDALEVSGIDFKLVDEHTQPPVTLPVDDVDFELRGLRYPFAPGYPVLARGFVSFGAVELRERKEQRSLVTNVVGGVVSSARSVVPGQGGQGAGGDARPLGAIDFEANLELAPSPTGRVRFDVNALELQFLGDRAGASGIDLRGGLLDASVELDMGAKGLSASTRTTWTGLDVTEDENGPVRKYLKLPVPLNMMIFLLRDRHGQVRLDFDFKLPPEGMTVAAATAKATEAIGQVVTRAVANSPMRVAGAAGDVLRLGTETVDGVFGATGLGKLSPFKKKEREGPLVETLTTTYDPGAILLSDVRTKELVDFIARWAKSENLLTVRHDLGDGDIARAEILANPTADETRALILRFERKRRELSSLRRELASAAVDEYSAGDAAGGDLGARRFSELDRELGRTEAALDQLYELVRPGAERMADRRTRSTALSLADRRLELLKRVLFRRYPETKGRVRFLRPRYTTTGDAGGGSLLLESRP